MNTDDYEGHTPAPWMKAGEGWVQLWDLSTTYDNKADAQLIIDAPDLLAEIKRLRKQVQAAHEWVQDYFDTPMRGLGGSSFADWIEYMKWEGNGGLKE